jgi:hypothetical protein
MPTIKEVKMQLRHKEWAEQITECQSSGLSVMEWCQSKGLSCNTYYRHLRIVRLELLGQADKHMQKIVPISVVSDICKASIPDTQQTVAAPLPGNIMMRKNGIEIELPQNISEDTIIALLKRLKQC